MSFFGKKRRETAAPETLDGVPDLSGEFSSEELSGGPESSREGKFRAREKVTTEDEENFGLPSVNRRTGMNKFVTMLGFAFFICFAVFLLVKVNSDMGSSKRKPKEEAIANNLPPLDIPVVTPQPIALARPTPPIPPIEILNVPPPQKPAGMTWMERKMAGKLLVGDAQASNSGDAAVPRATSVRSQGEEGNESGKNALSVQLEPTLTPAVSASILPDRKFLITKNTSLDCVLETALDSTVPGLTSCRLTRDIYSENGEVLLLDRGSRLDGEYKGGLQQGQARLFILWTRAKTPKGVAISLNSPGADALGRSGVAGFVDNHFMERFGAAVMMSFVNLSVNSAVGNRTSNGQTVVYGPVVTDGSKIVEKILDSTVNIPPTMVKNQGDHIQVMVARDLDFASVYGLRNRK